LLTDWWVLRISIPRSLNLLSGAANSDVFTHDPTEQCLPKTAAFSHTQKSAEFSVKLVTGSSLVMQHSDNYNSF
jgi:hypothetical protein